MIAIVQDAYPTLSIRQLCVLLGVNRAWYYAQQIPDPDAAKKVALRDAIEQIILTFPGYGYRRVT